MKTFKLFSIFVLFCSLQVLAQNPLVGTWRLLSAKGTDANGNAYAHDDSQAKQLKIITPTHFMFITEILGDSAGFANAGGGSYIIDGNKYIEILTTASWKNYDQCKTDFTWKVAGDQFYQDGTLTFADGSQITIHEIWQKVNLPAQATDAVGTWKRLTTQYIDENGKQVTKDDKQEKQTFIITPTHWMRITEDATSNSFLKAAGGTYTKAGDKYLPKIELASWDHYREERFEVTLDITRDKMVSKEANVTQNTKWTNTYKRLDLKPKLAKTSSAK